MKLYFYLFTALICVIHAFGFSRDKCNDLHNAAIVNEFECFTQAAITALKIPGAAVAIVTPEKILSLKTYGVRKLGKPEKVDAHTVFRLASLSKGFTGALALKLSQKGILGLDAPIINYLPKSLGGNRWLLSKEIKVKHILSHSSGVGKYCLEDNAYIRQSFSKLMGKLQYARQVSAPGERCQYQNVIFSLMDPIVAHLTRKKFARVLEKEILFPLGMDHTYLTEKTYNRCKNTASPHWRKRGKHSAIPIKDLSYYYNIVPAGGMASSITDMSKWLQALLGGSPLFDKKDLNTLFAPLITVEERRQCLDSQCVLRLKGKLEEEYGLGWRLQNYHNQSIVFHGGILHGITCGIAFSPKYSIGIVVLTNAGESHMPLLLQNYFLIYYLGIFQKIT